MGACLTLVALSDRVFPSTTRVRFRLSKTLLNRWLIDVPRALIQVCKKTIPSL